MLELAAVLALTLLAALAVLQLALVAGAPLGRLTWGGAHRVLPTRLRIGSAVAVGLYAGFAAVVLSRADLVTVIAHEGVVGVGTWVLTAYLVVGTLANAASRSRPERLVMTPVSALLALAFLGVALGG